MSSGPPVRKPKPRSRSASWKLESPRSKSIPSTAPKPASGATVASSRKFAWRRTRRSPNRGWRRPATLAMAAPSASRPRRRPSGSVAPRIRSVCPPPPRVASIWRLPGAGASIDMTSTAMTGMCPTSISPPPFVDRIPSGPWKRMWCELDPEALEGLGQLLRVGEGLAVGRPGRRDPDLCVVAGADDDGVAGELDVVAQEGRQQDPALLVDVDLGRAGEDEALEPAGGRIGDGQRRDLGRQVVPAGLGVDGQ